MPANVPGPCQCAQLPGGVVPSLAAAAWILLGSCHLQRLLLLLLLLLCCSGQQVVQGGCSTCDVGRVVGRQLELEPDILEQELPSCSFPPHPAGHLLPSTHPHHFPMLPPAWSSTTGARGREGATRGSGSSAVSGWLWQQPFQEAVHADWGWAQGKGGECCPTGTGQDHGAGCLG